MSDTTPDTPADRTDPAPPVVDRANTTAPWARWWGPRRALALVLSALTLYYCVNVALVYRAGRNDEAAPVDAIVVLGAAQYDGRPSPQLAARLDHVVTLWKRGLAEYVVVTGGNQPGDRFTEASASKDYLVERGVPEEVILAEDTSRNTYDSLAAVSELLGNLPPPMAVPGSVLLVTDPFHAARAELIAEEVGLSAKSSPTPTSVVRGWRSFRAHLKEAAGVSVGRIIGFERLTSITG